jgi:hypothetical protein
VTGIASKDQSKISAERVAIKNAEYSLMAFRKKPEYGGAHIDLNKITVANAVQELLVELKSTITLDGVEIEGNAKLDIDALYARFE